MSAHDPAADSLECYFAEWQRATLYGTVDFVHRDMSAAMTVAMACDSTVVTKRHVFAFAQWLYLRLMNRVAVAEREKIEVISKIPTMSGKLGVKTCGAMQTVIGEMHNQFLERKAEIVMHSADRTGAVNAVCGVLDATCSALHDQLYEIYTMCNCYIDSLRVGAADTVDAPNGANLKRSFHALNIKHQQVKQDLIRLSSELSDTFRARDNTDMYAVARYLVQIIGSGKIRKDDLPDMDPETRDALRRWGGLFDEDLMGFTPHAARYTGTNGSGDDTMDECHIVQNLRTQVASLRATINGMMDDTVDSMANPSISQSKLLAINTRLVNGTFLLSLFLYALVVLKLALI